MEKSMSMNEERHQSEGRIVTVRVRLTEIGDDFFVIEPIKESPGQSMVVAPEDIVDLNAA
jgi:hypothetical protein